MSSDRTITVDAAGSIFLQWSMAQAADSLDYTLDLSAIFNTTGDIVAQVERLDETCHLLAEAGVDRKAICTARLYLEDVRGEIGAVNEVWKEYFGNHPVCRRAYGVALQAGMRVEAAFTAEIP